MIAAMPSAISLNTPVEDLHNFKIARLGPVLSRKLARALTSQVHKKSAAEVTVEDLLTYFPMRYEDRSRPALIRDLHDGVEASLELTVTNAHGYAMRNPRSYGRPRLYIFEVSGIDGPMSGREVIVWWFVSGPRAYDIVKYYTAKLVRGTKFITFGRWEWEARRNTYKLRLNKPADEPKCSRLRKLRKRNPAGPGRREPARSSACRNSRGSPSPGLSKTRRV